MPPPARKADELGGGGGGGADFDTFFLRHLYYGVEVPSAYYYY